VKPWSPGAKVPRRSILQEHIAGTPGSIVFVAARGRAVPIGFSRQLVGVAAFGATGYRYCGSILSSAADPQFEREQDVFAVARAMTDVVTSEFDLVGLNGIDFVARDGIAFPIEVNPRWSASMELVERAHAFSVFGAHVSACTGDVPSFDLQHARYRRGAIGKAIVFARRAVVVGDTRAWLDQPDLRDIPRAGDRIRAGEPVCTVFAEARDASACRDALMQRAQRIYAQLETWRQEAA
jgi:predicted ATP-grasp superfamily ATP-dependent carboligase